MRLDGKIAIVTGGGSGFGEGIVRTFIAEGCRVAIVDLRLDQAERVARDVDPGRVLALQADVSKRSDIDAAIARVTTEWGVPDIVVNNAGYTHPNRPLLEVDEASFDRVFDVNVKSIFHMVHAVVPAMRDNGGGSIINVGSVAGIRPRPGLTWYNASKGAANLLSKSLALELAPIGIRVNAICPVLGDTGLLTAFMGVEDTPENRAKFVATIPLGRLARPDDIAHAALYLATAEFVTGVELPVDGGRVI